jgi:hypothetical protein
LVVGLSLFGHHRGCLHTFPEALRFCDDKSAARATERADSLGKPRKENLKLEILSFQALRFCDDKSAARDLRAIRRDERDGLRGWVGGG